MASFGYDYSMLWLQLRCTCRNAAPILKEQMQVWKPNSSFKNHLHVIIDLW